MSRTQTVRRVGNANHVGPLLSSFDTVRILNCIAAGSPYARKITDHLRRNGHSSEQANIIRLLNRMARAGWIKPKRPPSDPSRHPSWSTTPAGRAALAQARQCLKHLHQTLRRKQTTPTSHENSHNHINRDQPHPRRRLG